MRRWKEGPKFDEYHKVHPRKDAFDSVELVHSDGRYRDQLSKFDSV